MAGNDTYLTYRILTYFYQIKVRGLTVVTSYE